MILCTKSCKGAVTCVGTRYLYIANVNGAWITINSDFRTLIPKLKRAIDNHDDMVIAETLYELDKIRMRQQ